MNTITGSPEAWAPPRRDWPLALLICAAPAALVTLALGHLLGPPVAVFAGGGALALSVVLLQRTARSAGGSALRVAYGALHAAAWLWLGHAFVRPMDPTGFALWVAAAVLYVPFAMVGGRAWSFFAVLFAALLGWITWRIGRVVGYVPYALGLLWAWRHRYYSADILKAWPKTLLQAPVLVLPLAGFVGILRLAERGDLVGRILAQPQVKAIWTVGSESWPLGLSRQVRFAMDLCSPDILIVGASGDRGKASLMRWDLATGEARLGWGVLRGSNLAAVDCERGRFFVGSESTHEILEYGFDDLSFPRREWTVPGSRPRFLTLFGNGRYLAATDDVSFAHHLVDTESGSILDVDDLHASKCMFEHHGELWVAWDSVTHRGAHFDIVTLDSGVPHVRQSGPFPADRRGFQASRLDVKGLCAFDPVGDQLFFSALLGGSVTRLRLSADSPAEYVDVGPGVRFVAVEPSRRLLAVANYLTGRVLFFGADDLDARGEVFLGPRVRWLDFTADGRALYAPSSAGVFEVDLGPFLREWEQTRGSR